MRAAAYRALRGCKLPAVQVKAMIQLLGDIGVVTGFVYFTGGLYSPFSFLYLTVIVVGGCPTMITR